MIGTPIDLGPLIDSTAPIRQATYELAEVGEPTLKEVLARARPDRRKSARLTAVVALGGNALIRPGERGTAAEQRANLRGPARRSGRCSTKTGW